MDFYKTFLIFLFFSLILLFVLFFIIFLLRKYLFPFLGFGLDEIKLIKSFPIEKKLRILIVEVFGKIYFLAIGEKNITILEKIEEKEKIDKIKEELKNEIIKRKNFFRALFKK